MNPDCFTSENSRRLLRRRRPRTRLRVSWQFAGAIYCLNRLYQRLLSDSDLVQEDLDIAEYTDPDHNPMIPHVIVLEPGLIVYKIYNGYWFFSRPTLEDLRQDLRAATRKCRPDWDITTPEMNVEWREGRMELFYPYGKTYAQTWGEQD